MNKTIYFIVLVFVLSINHVVSAHVENTLLKDVKFEQKIGARLDSKLNFIDEQDQKILAKNLFRNIPSIFVFSYSHCKNLCPMIVNDLTKGLSNVKKKAGIDFNVLFLSIDPTDSKQDLKERKKTAPQGWFFLRGTDAVIKKAASDLGFSYSYDQKSNQYAHPSGLVFLTPKGFVSSYLLGVNFKSDAIERGLKTAGEEKRGSLVEDILLYCFHYDPTNGKYGSLIIRSIRIGGIFTLVALGYGIFLLNRKVA